MAMVIAVYNSDGCVGRCDARCHRAKGFDCNCICGGALHGVGTDIAREDHQYISGEEIIAECRKRGADGRLWTFRAAVQLGLFEP